MALPTVRRVMRRLKCALFAICEALGLFKLAARFVPRGLQILCYHGFQVADECAFRPRLFISARTFEERLDYLRRNGYAVLPFHEALERLNAGTLPDKAVAITIDDGFRSTLTVASPLLRSAGFPATVYVTTYYVDRPGPIYRLAIQYVFWKG